MLICFILNDFNYYRRSYPPVMICSSYLDVTFILSNVCPTYLPVIPLSISFHCSIFTFPLL